jgi:hypothetical protein
MSLMLTLLAFVGLITIIGSLIIIILIWMNDR